MPEVSLDLVKDFKALTMRGDQEGGKSGKKLTKKGRYFYHFDNFDIFGQFAASSVMDESEAQQFYWPQ